MDLQQLMEVTGLIEKTSADAAVPTPRPKSPYLDPKPYSVLDLRQAPLPSAAERQRAARVDPDEAIRRNTQRLQRAQLNANHELINTWARNRLGHGTVPLKVRQSQGQAPISAELERYQHRPDGQVLRDATAYRSPLPSAVDQYAAGQYLADFNRDLGRLLLVDPRFGDTLGKGDKYLTDPEPWSDQ